MNEMQKNCSFCDDQMKANYLCPKCGQFYCSIKCYNCEKHLNCKEMFYKKCVEDELRLRSKESDHNELKRSTLEILKREYYQTIKEDESDFNELKTRFDEMHLKDENYLWSNLDHNEKENFIKLLKQNEILNLLPVDFWTPWYLKIESNKCLIEEINPVVKSDQKSEDKFKQFKDDKVEMLNQFEQEKINKKSIELIDEFDLKKDEFIKKIEDQLKELNFKIPELKGPIKKLTDLTKIKPSVSVKCTVINLLFSYCFLCRHFNNDHLLFANESFHLISEISLLNRQIEFKSTRESIQFTIQLLINKQKVKTDFILILIDDLKFILTNQNKIYLNIIADLIKLTKLNKKVLNNERTNKTINDLVPKSKVEKMEINDKSKDEKTEINDKSKDEKNRKLKELNNLIKKLEYYLSYSNEHQELLVEQINEIDLERFYLLNMKKVIDENLKDGNKNEVKFY